MDSAINVFQNQTSTKRKQMHCLVIFSCIRSSAPGVQIGEGFRSGSIDRVSMDGG